MEKTLLASQFCWGIKIPVPGGGVGFVLHEELYHGVAPSLHRLMQRGAFGHVHGANDRARIQEQGRGGDVRGHRRPMQRGGAVAIPDGNCGAVGQQDFDGCPIARGRGIPQRSETVVVPCFEDGALVQQKLHQASIAPREPSVSAA